MSTSFKKSTENLNSCKTPWKERVSRKEKQEIDERQKVPNYMVMNVNEYGNRGDARLVAGEAGAFCLAIGTAHSPESLSASIHHTQHKRSASLRTASFWWRKPEIRTQDQTKKGEDDTQRLNQIEIRKVELRLVLCTNKGRQESGWDGKCDMVISVPSVP